ncbi:MAG: hypothetical protein JNK15_18290 [Planctomycetes bacterium]|nr:hypothetical protein [Planctomycetota bacterium]
MPNPTPWWRLASSTALLFLLFVLPSCTTMLLWGGRTSGSDAELVPMRGATLEQTPAGKWLLQAQLSEPLPDGMAPDLPRGRSGDWLVVAIERKGEALAEILRVAATSGKPPQLLVSIYQDDDVLVDAALDVPATALGAIRMLPGLTITRGERLDTQANGKAVTLLEARPAGGADVARPTLRWWRPRPNEPRYSLPEKVIYTPFTLLLDVIAIPTVPLGLLYWNTYHSMGGRS